MIYEALTLGEFDQFYTILQTHFPTKEIKEYQYLKGLFQAGNMQAITLKEKGIIIGVLSYFDLQDFAFVDYFAIMNIYQGQQLGQKMLAYFKEYIAKPFVLEVELPEDTQSIRRIEFYKRNGMQLNEYTYIVPKMLDMSEELQFLLMSYPKLIQERDYSTIYQRIMNEVYQIDKYQ